MEENTRSCKTCRYGLPIEESVTIDCKWGPDEIHKLPDDWCFRWMPKFTREQETFKEE